MSDGTMNKEPEELTQEEKLDLINRVMETASEDGCFDKVLGLRAVSMSEGIGRAHV